MYALVVVCVFGRGGVAGFRVWEFLEFCGIFSVYNGWGAAFQGHCELWCVSWVLSCVGLRLMWGNGVFWVCGRLSLWVAVCFWTCGWQ